MEVSQKKRRKATSSQSNRSRRSTSSSSASSPTLFEQAWIAVTDGRGNDITGVLLLILAVISGASIYSGADSAPGSWPNTVFGVVFGLLKYLVPPVLVVVGVVLIRGPRDTSVYISDDGDEPWDTPVATDEAAEHRRYVGRVVGLILGVLILSGMFDVLLIEEGHTIDTEGFNAYESGGGIVGATVGSLAVFGGRWAALGVLTLLAIFTISLISGRSVAELARQLWNVSRPAVSSVLAWFSTLFKVGSVPEGEVDAEDEPAGDAHDGSVDETDPEGRFFDQDADAVTEVIPKRRRAPKKPKDPPVVVTSRGASDGDDPEQLQMDLDTTGDDSSWRLPPLKLLSRSDAQEVDQDQVAERGRRLEGALAEHGVETRLIGMTVGPAATRYELELGVGVKVAKVTALHKDIAYAMASPDVRILAPIPGRQAIGVEVPNAIRELITLGDILGSTEARRATHPLEVGVGRGMNGENVMINLAAMPHILIAGQTGAGKSSCINSILTSIMMRATPEQVRLILVDPKLVELTQYAKIPHLLTQVVTDPKKAANALGWAAAEMERRYEVLSEIGVRDIDGYNRMFQSGELEVKFPEREFKRMPFILVVVDELANLMLVAAKEVENSINVLAAKARAVGIHLVLATQRPSVDVITGLIKSNIPARLAFAVTSATDSKVILDQVGAEKLTGKGDMLLLAAGATHPQRIQGSWVSESEVRAASAQWQMQAPHVEEQYSAEIVETSSPSLPSGSGGSGSDDDELLLQAMELVVRAQSGSTSMLQRKLKVGFARAGRLMDLLEERGVVGPSEGSKSRQVLMTPEELDRMIEDGEL